MTPSNTANILGALALRLADELTDGLARDHAPTVSAALLLLQKYPGISVEGLRGPLLLSHSGCVRLVDRLEREGFVMRRTATEDARAVSLHLTRKGREAASVAHETRQQILLRTLSALTQNEQETLGRLAAKLLDGAVQVIPAALRTCRLCDYEVCTECPMQKFADETHQA